MPVKRPRRTLLIAAVAAKRFLARSFQPGHRSRTDDVRPGQPVSGLSGIREAYFRFVYVVDEYKKWAWRAARAAIKAGVRNHASVLVASGPPHSALVAGAWAARALGIPFVADLRDPWSDRVDGNSQNWRPEHALVRRLERAVLRSASAVTSTGATVAELLVSRDESLTEKIHVIRNGYDGAREARTTTTRGRLSILFAGELYAGRDPFPFLHALEWLLAQPGVDSSRVRVTFMGTRIRTRGSN